MRQKLLLRVVALAATLWAAPAGAGDVEFYVREGKTWKLLHGTGALDDKIHLVILGDGFSTDGELQRYEEFGDQLCEALLREQPYRDFREDLNIWRINTRSRQSGVSVMLWCGKYGGWNEVKPDFLNSSPMEQKNTAFDTLRMILPPGGRMNTFHTGVKSMPWGAVTDSLTQAGLGSSAMSERVILMVLVNDLHENPMDHETIARDTAFLQAYRGFRLSSVSTHFPGDYFPYFFHVAIHELGHALGVLSDEYGYAPIVEYFKELKKKPGWAETDLINLSLRTDVTARDHKWYGLDMVWGVKPHPFFETWILGLYRPTFESCLMETGARQYCPVCLRGVRAAVDRAAGRDENPAPTVPTVHVVAYDASGNPGAPVSVGSGNPTVSLKAGQNFRLSMISTDQDDDRDGQNHSLQFYCTLTDEVTASMDPYCIVLPEQETARKPMTCYYSPWVTRSGGGVVSWMYSDYPGGSFIHYRDIGTYIAKVWAMDSGGAVSEPRTFRVEVSE